MTPGARSGLKHWINGDQLGRAPTPTPGLTLAAMIDQERGAFPSWERRAFRRARGPAGEELGLTCTGGSDANRKFKRICYSDLTSSRRSFFDVQPAAAYYAVPLSTL